MKITVGTSYFSSVDAAEKYYADYEDDPKRAVKIKLEEGSIHIGKPPAKVGERVFLNAEEGRYFIES